ncbi:MAG: zf-HC2 domain-containing protein [Ktedonobacteraceae bacterium]|nr:zf-HC2 domain-containing protein [Ktedonobacteraceae bacterium]
MNESQPQKVNDRCLDMGHLVSLRDNELTAAEQARAEAHLAECADCAADERNVATSSREVYELLATLDAPANVDPKVALADVQTKLHTESQTKSRIIPLPIVSRSEKMPLFEGKRRRGYAWLTAAVAAALLAVLLLPNAGVLADQFLSLFRVQQFQPVSINPQTFRFDLMTNFRSFGDMQVQYNDGAGVTDPTQSQVQQAIHFSLLLPSHLPPGVGQMKHFFLVQSGQGTFTFSAAQTRAYLASTGQSNVHIPDQLDGATFTITVDPGFVANYSDCSQGKTGSLNKKITSLSETTLAPCNKGSMFYLAEIPSPVLKATGKASLKDLRDFLLSLPKLSPEMHSMLQQLDLEKGVVPLPVPTEFQTQQVTVHGAQGVLLVDDSLKAGGEIWQAGGVIYMIATNTTSGTEIQNTANSLQ